MTKGSFVKFKLNGKRGQIILILIRQVHPSPQQVEVFDYLVRTEDMNLYKVCECEIELVDEAANKKIHSLGIAGGLLS